jgi:hypothetical protein
MLCVNKQQLGCRAFTFSQLHIYTNVCVCVCVYSPSLQPQISRAPFFMLCVKFVNTINNLPLPSPPPQQRILRPLQQILHRLFHHLLLLFGHPIKEHHTHARTHARTQTHTDTHTTSIYSDFLSCVSTPPPQIVLLFFLHLRLRLRLLLLLAGVYEHTKPNLLFVTLLFLNLYSRVLLLLMHVLLLPSSIPSLMPPPPPPPPPPRPLKKDGRVKSNPQTSCVWQKFSKVSAIVNSHSTFHKMLAFEDSYSRTYYINFLQYICHIFNMGV